MWRILDSLVKLRPEGRSRLLLQVVCILGADGYQVHADVADSNVPYGVSEEKPRGMAACELAQAP